MNSLEQSNINLNLRILENAMKIAEKINNSSNINNGGTTIYNSTPIKINIEDVKRIYKELKNLINE